MSDPKPKDAREFGHNRGTSMRHRAFLIALVFAALSAANTPAQAQQVAGVNPSMRPEQAPVISEFIKDGDWYERALTGITSPYPASLKFLEDQGAWFNPFLRPGMPGPYDLRGWHMSE